MSKRKVTLTLHEDVVEALDKRAESKARSRSAMTNLILKKALLDEPADSDSDSLGVLERALRHLNRQR